MTIFALHRIEPGEGDGRPAVREWELIALGLGVEQTNDEVLFLDRKIIGYPDSPEIRDGESQWLVGLAASDFFAAGTGCRPAA